MVADMQIQVWLETLPGMPTAVVAYAKTDRGAQMTYHIEMVNRGQGSMSRVSQVGTVRAEAGQKTELGDVGVSSQRGDECTVAVSIREGDQDRGTFRFDCPR